MPVSPGVPAPNPVSGSKKNRRRTILCIYSGSAPPSHPPSPVLGHGPVTLDHDIASDQPPGLHPATAAGATVLQHFDHITALLRSLQQFQLPLELN